VDPRAVLQPVGSRSPHVYWARRIALLAAVTVIALLLAHACSGSGSSSRDSGFRQRADQHPAPVITPSSVASRSPAPSRPITACLAGDLKVAVSADATTYPRGARPRFTAVVRNTGPACRFPTALSTRTWRIMSGTDQVWSTADCVRSTQGKPVRLKAGAQVTYVLPWDRFRSTPGCAVAGAPAQAGTYRLYVTIAGAAGPATVFHLAD
jgi:hypothetical protein